MYIHVHSLGYCYLYYRFITMAESHPKRAKRTYLCGHCNQELSKTQYYQHKKYYNIHTQKWQSESSVDLSVYDDFNFEFEEADLEAAAGE